MSDANSSTAPGPTIGPHNTPLIRIINFLSLVTVFILNGLSTGRFINNASNGELSDELPNYLVPQGYAFSIWGLIYFFLAAWGVYQLLPRSYDSAAINKGVGYVFPLNALANCTWIVVFAYRLNPISVVFLASVLATNLIIYLRLKIRFQAKTWVETLCIHTGFALYTSWTLGATLVNLWAVATTRDPKFIDQTIAVLVLLGALEIAISVWFRDPVLVLVGAWTLLANHVKNKDVEKLGTATLALAIILGVVGVGAAVVSLLKGGFRRSGSEQDALNKTQV